jgi:hypothetical protein
MVTPVTHAHAGGPCSRCLRAVARAVARVLVIGVAVAACQGHGGSGARSQGSGGSGGGTAGDGDAGHVAWPTPADAATSSGDGATGSGSGAAVADEPEVIDVGKAIADLGAIAAWQAVVDRAHYLARRNEHGVVFGTIGAPIFVLGTAPPAVADAGKPPDAGMVASDFTWLVDDTEGNGALAIRVELGPKGGTLKQGDRVALGGAWALDDDRHWYWKVDAVSALPPAAPSELKDPPAAPGHTIVNGELPSGARTISLAKDGDAVYFQLVGAPPLVDGDGWPVADELGNPVFALLNLPGERPSYGAQDMRSSDERWQLKRGQTYWLRIGKIRKHGADKPASINARTAPVRLQ